MKSFSKTVGSFVTCALFSTGLYAQSDEFKWLPIFNDDNFKANVEVAAVLGHMNFDGNTKDGAVYGLELSLDCPVFTLPGDNPLRQQFSVNRYDKNGFEVTTIEVNPYYFVDLSEDLLLGFGPGIGGVYGDPDNGQDQWLFAVQAGAGLKYYIDDVVIGADIRYQWTAEKDFGSGQKEDLDNLRLLMKVGYHF